MNLASLLILAIVLIAFAVALRSLKKKGLDACSGCKDAGACGNCRRKIKRDQECLN